MNDLHPWLEAYLRWYDASPRVQYCLRWSEAIVRWSDTQPRWAMLALANLPMGAAVALVSWVKWWAP